MLVDESLLSSNLSRNCPMIVQQTNESTNDAPEYIVIGVFFTLDDTKGAHTGLESISKLFAASLNKVASISTGQPTQNSLAPKQLVPCAIDWFWYQDSHIATL